ncbi:MAG: hypothetical protein RDV00_07395 [Clostridia bacterium]|nr:hypothetical protein [Clostridia bacterium]MDQ7791924.1 hypothetical protein [Clostridia bacterium]
MEFIYTLSNNKKDDAAKLVTKPGLVDEALKLGLVQKPLSAGWMLSLDHPETELKGPLIILDGPAVGVKVTFTQRNGQWLINGLTAGTGH